ncbi:MAG: transcription-repair coupling factor, partial [Coxiella sp. (in: Bacteria)]
MYSPLSPPALKQSDSKVNWGNLQRTTETLAIAKFTENSDGSSLIITSDVNGANRLHRELRFFMGPEQTPILHFPDWETLAFDHFSPHEDIISNRLATLHKASHLKNGIIIAALPTLLQRTLPRHHLAAHAFILQKGDKIRIDKLNVQLVQAGYHHVDAVREHGEFAVRGSIWDVFPTGSDSPFRIELFDDDIETIRSFDPETQLSKQQFDHIELLPAREYPLTDDAITHFRQQFRSQFSGNPRDCAIYEAISNGKPFPGTEYYLPLFYEQLDTFFDYLPEHCTVFIPNDIQEKFIKNWGDIEKRYEQLRYDRTRPLCTPSQLYLNQAQFFAKLKSHMQVRVSDELLDDKFGNYNFSRASLPNIQIESKEKQPLNKLKAFLDNVNYPILFTAESSGRRETLLDLLREIHITPHAIDSWTDFIATNSAQATHAICVAPLDHGLVLDDPELALIPEASLFGEQVMQRRLRNKQQTDVANLIHSLAELKIDAPVVHIQYGIARYKGLEVIETGDVKAEYLTLEYADKDKVYVPINSLHMISRYTGVDADHAKPNKLGSN